MEAYKTYNLFKGCESRAQARANTHWYLLYKLRNVAQKHHDSLLRRENVYDT